MFLSADVCTSFKARTLDAFSGFERKTLLIGTTLFYIVSSCLAAGYLVLDHPRLSLSSSTKSEQNTSLGPLSHHASYVQIYSTSTTNTGAEIQKISDVLVRYDLTGIATAIQCDAQICSVEVQVNDPNKRGLVGDVTRALMLSSF